MNDRTLFEPGLAQSQTPPADALAGIVTPLRASNHCHTSPPVLQEVLGRHARSLLFVSDEAGDPWVVSHAVPVGFVE